MSGDCFWYCGTGAYALSVDLAVRWIAMGRPVMLGTYAEAAAVVERDRPARELAARLMAENAEPPRKPRAPRRPAAELTLFPVGGAA